MAVTLPSRRREVVGELIRGLRNAAVPGLRPVAPEGAHVTLKFLGNVARSRLCPLNEALTAAGGDVTPFSLELRGVGAFPNALAPRVLWVGLGGDTEALSGLARRVDAAYATLGFTPERRRFSPHLTIARIGDGVAPGDRRRAAAALDAVGLDDPTPFLVEAFHLIKSVLTPSGPIYETIHTVTLGGSHS